jgi:hypothetical protein
MFKKCFSIALVFTTALSGCVEPSETSVTGPSGQAIRTSKCSQSPDGCFQKAAAACEGSYQVLDSYSKAGGLVADLLPGPVTWYYMTYQCGKTDGRLPAFEFRGQSYQPPPVIMTAPATPRMTTTNCNRFGSTVNCTTY